MDNSFYLAITFLSSHHKHLLLIISVSSTNCPSSSEVTMDTPANTPNNPSSLTLLCQAVDEDKNLFEDVFPVTVQSSVLVGELKEQVFAEMKPLLEARGIVAFQLTLWKVSTLIPTADRVEICIAKISRRLNFLTLNHAEALNGNGVVQLLSPAEQLDTYWTEEPEGKRLHLVVKVPHRSVDDGKLLSFIPYLKR